MVQRDRRRVAMCALIIGVSLGSGSAQGQIPEWFGSYRTAADFDLRDVRSGRSVKLSDSLNPESKTNKVVVLVFTGVSCPIGDLYMPTLGALAEAYKDKGVQFLAINSNAHDTFEQVADHARRFKVPFPVLKDPGNVVADVNLVERTCEVLVLARMREIRYRGAIDDQYGPGTHKDAPDHRYLAEALDATLAGRKVATPVTLADGCLLDRVQPQAAARRKTPRVRGAAGELAAAYDEREPQDPIEVGSVTYAADVAAILQQKCQSCHRPGQVGPFPLLTYDETVRHAAMIREVVDDRRMPPWHADPRYGQFENDRSLSAAQRATLLAWVDRGCPLGDAKAVPAPRAFPVGYAIGKPDLVIEMPEPYTVPAQGTVPYQYFRVPSGFTEDRWVQAAEARPGDPSVVHHVLVAIDDHKPKTEADEQRVPQSHFVAYAPGDLPMVLPPGTAKRIPAGSDFIIQMHYTPVGTVRTDRSSIALIFANAPPRREAHTLGIVPPEVEIPPGADNHAVQSSYVFPVDAELYSLMPHMHLRGKSFRYTATFPDGRREILLSVPGYDFAWQSVYRLARPRPMPKGTRIDCLAHFDNSSRNPSNPDPSRKVVWGEQTFEEMMIGYIDVAFLDRTPETVNQPVAPSSGRRLAP
jgi:thiol-disulfide isomerase/thioredoxin/mono/diheme cytochrome c family protein